MKKLLIIFIFTLSLFRVNAFAQGEGDKIVAIVGNEAILESDLNNQLYMFAQRYKLNNINQAILDEVLNQMINEKLILAKADQDSIMVRDEEIQKQVDYRIETLVQQYGSEKNLENLYGITIVKIKSLIREDIKKQIKIDKMKQMKFAGGLTVTRTEVEKFFKDNRDSIPEIPETFELFQIALTPIMSDDAKRIAKEKAQLILDSVKSGVDFSELARRNSDDSGSAVQGGDLGKVKKGVFVKEFEDAAFLLKPGEVSDLTETVFGYHIIKLIDKTGEQVHAQHILVKFPRLESADFDAINKLKDYRIKATGNEKLFKEMAVQYSIDKNAIADSGYTGKIAITSLDSTQIMALKDLKPGEISEPIKIGMDQDYSYNIFMLKEKYPAHTADFDKDYKEIEQMALKYKEQKELKIWFEELRKTIYVDVKI